MSFERTYATDIIVDKNGALVVKHAPSSPTVGNNRTIVTGVSGKKIRILGGHLTAAGTAATILFKSASGGTTIYGPIDIPANSLGQKLDLNAIGWMESLNNSEGIFADVTGATVNVSLRYIEVTY